MPKLFQLITVRLLPCVISVCEAFGWLICALPATTFPPVGAAVANNGNNAKLSALNRNGSSFLVFCYIINSCMCAPHELVHPLATLIALQRSMFGLSFTRDHSSASKSLPFCCAESSDAGIGAPQRCGTPMSVPYT